VPADRLDAVVAALASVGRLEDRTTSAEDVTEDYFDLELHLSNQRALEARVLALLGRPGNQLSDLLDAERELARIRGEIEQLEGRQRFWDNQVALATLTLRVHEPEPPVGASEGGAFAALRRSFQEAADNFVYAVAGIIALSGSLVPILAVVVIAGWLVARGWWAARRRTRAAKAA
jgi:hypothetical protein